MSPLAFLASTPHTNAAKIFLNWILTREGQNQFQKLIFPNKASSIRFSFSILTESIFSPGLEEFKDKINAFLPWLESLVQNSDRRPTLQNSGDRYALAWRIRSLGAPVWFRSKLVYVR